MMDANRRLCDVKGLAVSMTLCIRVQPTDIDFGYRRFRSTSLINTLSLQAVNTLSAACSVSISDPVAPTLRPCAWTTPELEWWRPRANQA